MVFLKNLLFGSKSSTLIASGTIFLFLLLNTSCLKYQYLTISSNLASTKSNSFRNSKDSIEVFYSFTGVDGHVKIGVKNNTNKPIYVDWQKSSMITDSINVPFWKNKTNYSSTTSGYGIGGNVFFGGSAVTSGFSIKADHITFVPPQSIIYYHPYNLMSDFISIPDTIKQKNQKLIKYKKKDSPFKFRSYITISNSENFIEPMVFESDFWISTIQPSALEPTPAFYKKENNFVVADINTFGEIVGIVSGIGVIAYVVLISTAE